MEDNMQALFDRILTINLVASTVVFAAAARVYVLPKLSGWSWRTIMVPILLLHSFRHLGLMFLTRGGTDPGLPLQFAYPAAFGDLLAAGLAFVAFVAVVQNHPAQRALVWVFNVEGTLDLMLATALATVFSAAPYMGPAYWIPALWVPALLVTHYVTFRVLSRSASGVARVESDQRTETLC
jgi:hypothetical protein